MIKNTDILLAISVTLIMRQRITISVTFYFDATGPHELNTQSLTH